MLTAIGSPQQASAAGKFDGDWKGDLACIQEDQGGGSGSFSADSNIDITKNNILLKIRSGAVISHDNLLPPGDTSFKSSIKASKIQIQARFPPDGTMALEGTVKESIGKSGVRKIELTGNIAGEVPCHSVLTMVSPLAVEGQSIAGAERLRLQQEIAALRKVESIRRHADLERQRKNAEAARVAEIERQRQAEKSRKAAEVERHRLAEQIANLKKMEVDRKAQLAKEEALRKAAERKTTERAKAVKPPRKGNELTQQLATLKSLKDSGLINQQEHAVKKQALLNRFLNLKPTPNTQTASLPAKPKLSPIQVNLAKYKGIEFGKYYALVIGSNDYKFLPKLDTAAADAREIAKRLKSDYGFSVKLLTDATRDEILDALDEYREKLTDADNLLIYYAGHGWLDEAGEQGYWLPVDARPNRRRDWVSNSDITSTLRAVNAKHVLVMADSCYSGTLVRGAKIVEATPDYVQRMAEKRARLVITSGGLEPVADKDGAGKHSPFASVFLDILKSNNGVMDGTNMFSKMRRPVMLKADQTPEYSDVRKAGHEGGDFLFVRRR
jgi:hypothetical protein